MKDEKLENIAMIFTIVFIALIILTVLAIWISSIAYDVIYHSHKNDYLEYLKTFQDQNPLWILTGHQEPSYVQFMQAENYNEYITYKSLAITSGVLGSIIFILGFIGLLNGALD